jgi:hypothetical protein
MLVDGSGQIKMTKVRDTGGTDCLGDGFTHDGILTECNRTAKSFSRKCKSR